MLAFSKKKTLLHEVRDELTRHNFSIQRSIKINKCAEKLADIRNRHIQLTFLTDFFFNVLLTVHLNIFRNINQLEALNFIISLFQGSTCFEHICSSSGGQNCYYTVSGIFTPIGGRPVHSLNLCTGWPPIGVMIPDAV